MSTSNDLSGLMKFAERDAWAACFDEVFGDHVEPVLDGADLTLGDLAGLLGADWGTTVWGCAFEDFLTQDFDIDGSNIVDEYLKRRGWKESAGAKAYMKALRTSVMSLYEVSEVVPGKTFLARDLIRGGDPVKVSEATATNTLKQWDRIAARIVPVLGKTVLAGGLLPFSPAASEDLFYNLRRVFGKRNAKKLPHISDEDLQAAASLFTLSWLSEAIDQSMTLPALQNSDGDEIVFHDVRFPLASGTTQKAVATRIDALPQMSKENAKFWNWLEDTTIGKAGKKDALSLDTTMDNGKRVLGTIELARRFLVLSTNSAARAETGTALLEKALGALARSPLTEIRTLEQAMAENRDKENDASAAEIPPQIADELLRQYLDRHYRETLDQPVGMLGDKTPRQAARSAAGRQKVAEWLKFLENSSAKHADPDHPMATYSFDWMWEELGVADLRK